MSSTVLILEDDATTTDFVARYLRHDGHRVVTAADGEAGLELALRLKPDLIVLDLMLPKLDGIEVCKAIRAESDVGIIMLTARVEEKDRLEGLEVGADDYVTKPFSPRELAARVRAVLRRAVLLNDESGPRVLVYHDVTLDVGRRVIERAGRSVKLTPTEVRIMRVMMAEPHRTFTRERIIDRVFGDEFVGFDRTVDTHISNLRRKLRFESGFPEYMQAVYGEGYRFDDA